MNIYTRNGNIIGNVTPIDATPTENSTNTVQSGGVYTAIDGASGGDSVITKAPKNLFDKTKAVLGNTDTSGNVIASESYYVSDFAEVEYGQKYICNNVYYATYYTSAKAYISKARAYNNQLLTIPETAVYVRLTVETANIDTAICADIRYYTDGVTSGEEIAGVTDDLLTASHKSLSAYAEQYPEQFAVGRNMFDYEHDFVQVTSTSVGGGVLQTNGDFKYRTDTIVTDGDITGVFIVGLDKYFPVTEGQMIVTNKYVRLAVFYNSNKEFISIAQNRYAYQGIKAPANTAFVRINLQGNTTDPSQIHSLSEIKDIIIWTVPVIGSNDLIPQFQYPQFPYQIDGNVISPNYLDKVIPNMAESQFLSAMRCMAIREANAREHAWRFGNFNMWIMESTKGWNMTKKMLMDYGVDFCGFEECVINQSTAYYKGIAEFLHGWQFPSGFYTNWTDGAETQIDKSFVSRFNVTESTKLSFPSASSNASYLNCKVALPRYMDVKDPFRILSCYIVHFPITTETEKVAVAKDLLNQIATDDSDFIVIMGDTNDFGTTEETKSYWRTIEAGGFAPVLPYDIKTVTQDQSSSETWHESRSLDQFFVSDNIKALGYGIKNTKEDYALEDGYTSANTDGEQALSDHDFVWCDLQFDYSKPRTIVPVPTE